MVQPELDVDLDESFAQAKSTVLACLPDDSEWTADGHEHGLAAAINKPTTPSVVAADSVRLLLAVAGRTPLTDPFRSLRIAQKQLSVYPVHLQALGHQAEALSGHSLREAITQASMDWGFHLHNQVAYRKLRQQLNDTFQIRPTDTGGFRVHREPRPTFGNPRFAQALRVLEDVGAIDRSTGRPTALGQVLMERVDA